MAKPRRQRLPDTRQSITHKFNVAGHEGYITVGLYEDGRPGELFITMAKEGSTVGGLMDCFGTAVSMSLQYGVPLEVYVNKFSHTRFEPMGHTKNPDIRIAKSIVDYIFRWLGITFLPGYREASVSGYVEEASALLPTTRKQQPGPAAKMAGGQANRPGAGQIPGRQRHRRPAASGTNGSAAHGAATALAATAPRKTVPAKTGTAKNGTAANGTDQGLASGGTGVVGRQRRAVAAGRRGHEGRVGSRSGRSDRAVRSLPDRCAELRQLRRHHRAQRQLLFVPQLWQQHGLLVMDCRVGCPRATHLLRNGCRPVSGRRHPFSFFPADDRPCGPLCGDAAAPAVSFSIAG